MSKIQFPGHPNYDHMRTWQKGDFRLELWDTHKLQRGGPQRKLAYQLWDKGKLIFQGHDYGCSPLQSIDGDGCVASLLNFLSLKPGDTDREYFLDYTPEQLAWCKERGEELSMMAFDLERTDNGWED